MRSSVPRSLMFILTLITKKHLNHSFLSKVSNRNQLFHRCNDIFHSTKQLHSTNTGEATISEDESTYHTPVMMQECIDALLLPPSKHSKYEKVQGEVKKRRIFIDGTLGGGGHTNHLLKHLSPNDIVFGCDVDMDAIKTASERLHKYMQNNTNYPKFIPLHSNFCNVHNMLQKHPEYFIQNGKPNFHQIDGILLDLGVSSHQINTPTRGFTYASNGPLDMRMSSNLTLTAANICNEFSRQELSTIFQTYGDENRNIANSIAQSIIYKRPLNTTMDLVDAIYATNKIPKYHKKSKRYGLSSTSARIFQSLRIYINKEDQVLEDALIHTYPKLLTRQGKLVILSYHSMEDRIVKHLMKHGNFIPKRNVFVQRDIYGNELGGEEKLYKMIGKFVMPSEEEVERNVRARSAKLRVAERL